MTEVLSNTYQLNEELKMLAVETIHHKKLFFLLNPKKTSTKRFIDTVNENYSIGGINADEIKIIEKISNESIYPSTEPIERYCKYLTNEFMMIFKNTVDHSIEPVSEKREKELKQIRDMQIFVKTTLERTIYVPVPSDCTAKELILLIMQKLGDIKSICDDINSCTLDRYRMIFMGRQIEYDDKLITSYNMSDNSMVHLCFRLRGGMFDETSGRAGNYQEIKSIFISIEPDLSP